MSTRQVVVCPPANVLELDARVCSSSRRTASARANSFAPGRRSLGDLRVNHGRVESAELHAARAGAREEVVIRRLHQPERGAAGLEALDVARAHIAWTTARPSGPSWPCDAWTTSSFATFATSATTLSATEVLRSLSSAASTRSGAVWIAFHAWLPRRRPRLRAPRRRGHEGLGRVV